MGFTSSWKFWAAVAVVIVGLVMWMQLGNAIWNWRYHPSQTVDEGRKTIDDLEQVKKERAASQAVIRDMTKRINDLSADAVRLRFKADEEAKSRLASDRTISDLRIKMIELERSRQTQPKATTVSEAVTALQRLGY